MTYYWLSFVNDERPPGKRFVGGCLVQADGVEGAVREAWRRKCNPGGEVQIVEITAKYEPNVARFKINHLYDKAELEAMGEFRTLTDAIKRGDVT